MEEKSNIFTNLYKRNKLISLTVVIAVVFGGYFGYSALNNYLEEDELNDKKVNSTELSEKGDYDEAINEFEKVKNNSSSLSVKRDALVEIGISHMNKKDYPSANKAFAEAYDLNVEPTEKLLRSGSYAAEQVGEYETAIKYYEDLIEIAKSNNEPENVIDTYKEKIKQLEQNNE